MTALLALALLLAALLVSLAIAGLVSRLLAFGMSQKLGELPSCTCRRYAAPSVLCPVHGTKKEAA